MSLALASLRLMLGPALLWQGARVRRDIVRMPEPRGDRQGTVGTGPKLRLLILGDSSAAGVGSDVQATGLSGQLVSRLAQSHQVTWLLHAQTGWTTAEAIDALHKMPDQNFDLAAIQLGTNDVTTETGIDRWLEQYEHLLRHLAQQHLVSRFYLGGVPPMHRFPALPQPLRWYLGQQARAHDRALARFAMARADARHVQCHLPGGADIGALDGFHPGPAAYSAIADAYAAAILAE